MRLDHLLSRVLSDLPHERSAPLIFRLAAVQDELEDTIVFYHSSVAKVIVCGPVAQVVRAQS